MNLLLAILACAGTVKETDTSSAVSVDALCTELTDVTCVDEMILDLALHGDKVSAGTVETETSDNDFITYVDATAGGFMEAANNPWVYLRFTPTGAEKVEIDDETALESMEWDLSLKRYILRLNGGNSGPSCVSSTTLLEASSDDVSEVPEGLTFIEDEHYTSDCTIINDSSGLPNSPQVALGAWWTYPGCVATSMLPHIIQLADGSIVKLVVEAYYASGQDNCNTSGAMGTGSANFTLRWSYLE